jgi:IS5 family transposase
MHGIHDLGATGGRVRFAVDDEITSRCGERAVAELNDALIAMAAERRLIKMHKLRADTTVVEANVAYSVDSSLLARGIARIAKLTHQAMVAGLATRTRLRDPAEVAAFRRRLAKAIRSRRAPS